jgi:hypothetical protein
MLLVIFCIPLSAAAQHATGVPEQEVTEEIVIVGQRSVLQLRLQMLDAEKLAYDVFNSFNDDRRMEISCRQDQATGSLIRNQLCEPEFIIEVQADYARSLMDSRHFFSGNPVIGGAVPPRMPDAPVAAPSVQALVAARRRAFQARMRQVAEEHPEFLDALIEYSAARGAYEEAIGQTTRTKSGEAR